MNRVQFVYLFTARHRCFFMFTRADFALTQILCLYLLMYSSTNVTQYGFSTLSSHSLLLLHMLLLLTQFNYQLSQSQLYYISYPIPGCKIYIYAQRACMAIGHAYACMPIRYRVCQHRQRVQSCLLSIT